jgi:HEPN domain-containing protein
MTGRLHAWLRQAHSDLAMAAYASDGGFHAQACYHCSQAAEKALQALLLALDQEPERTHSIERLLGALELLGIETAPLRPLPLKALQRMTTASRYPDGDEAPVEICSMAGMGHWPWRWRGPWWTSRISSLGSSLGRQAVARPDCGPIGTVAPCP